MESWTGGMGKHDFRRRVVIRRLNHHCDSDASIPYLHNALVFDGRGRGWSEGRPGWKSSA